MSSPSASDPFDTALALHRAGDLSRAERAYRACFPGREVEIGPALSVLLLQQGRFKEAAALLMPLAEVLPADMDVAVNLSLALRRSARTEAALDVARRASHQAPERVSVWNALGLAAMECQRFDEALAALETGLRVAPGNTALALHRSQCLRHLGRHDAALAAFSGLVQASPDLLDAWRGLGNVQAALGHAGAALRSRVQALRLAPRDRDVMFEHGVALMQAGDASAAATVFEALSNTDEDAQAWCWLGRARLKADDLQGARAAFARAKALAPDDPTIAHFHAATTGELPQSVEGDYIRTLFDDFADRFERTLVGGLGYATPAHLARLLRAHGADTGDAVLDLGCGTGLMAAELARAGRHIDGVDLSPRMLDHAREKGFYRSLHAAEIVAFLREAEECWDLVIAADVFVYVADLRPVFAAVHDRLAAGGVFAFSVERSAGDDTELVPSTGRYRHAVPRLLAELEAAGFVGVVHEAAMLRRESDQPVQGELLLARRCGKAPRAGRDATDRR